VGFSESESEEAEMEEEEEWLKEFGSTTSVSMACWQLLERYLQRYDTSETNFKYHLAVAEKILSTDPRIKLPLWLVAAFKVRRKKIQYRNR
jgi:hypothetical protein